MLTLVLPAFAAEVFDLTPTPEVVGVTSSDSLGWQIVATGDLDGDGYDDVAANAWASPGRSGLRLFRGSPTGLDPTPIERMEPATDYGCCSGLAVADFDADGHPDVAVGSQVRIGGWYEPSIEVLRGDGVSVEATPSRTIGGPHNRAEQPSWGDTLAGLRDLDGDGFSDLAVGEVRYDIGSVGEVHVLRGSAAGLEATASWVLTAPSGHYNFGTAVASAGDVNGDGLTDLVVGNSRPEDDSTFGLGYLYVGSASGPDLHLEVGVVGMNEHFGDTVAGDGDLNGDGYDDAVVVQPGECSWAEDFGGTWVYWGDATQVDTADAQRLWCPDTMCGSFADSVDIAGDVDGDGVDELLVGNAQYRDDHALLFKGGATGVEPDPRNWLYADYPSTNYGGPVRRAGDLDGDGLADLLVSDPAASSATGAVQAWLGGALVEEATDTGDTGDTDDTGDSGATDTDAPTDSGADTAPPVDTAPDDVPTDDVPVDTKDDSLTAGGCACGATPTRAPWAALVAALLAGAALRRGQAGSPVRPGA